jgi:hypothetical protein
VTQHAKFIAGLVALAAIADAAPTTLLGRTIEAVIPGGYCEAGKHPADAELARRTIEGIGDSNQVLVLFANCKELEEFRRGKRFFLDNYGQILLQKPKGQLRALKGVTRPEFISKMAGRADFSEAFNKAEVRIRQFEPSYQSMENLGPLGADANGLYIGLLLAMTGNTPQPRRIVGVAGMTLVKEMPATVNIYQAYKASPDLAGLLARQKAAMSAFVQANN